MQNSLEETLRQMGVSPQSEHRATTLPDLPPSDPQSIQKNQFDGFYKTGARDFWHGNQIIQNKVEDFKKCVHYFVQNKNEASCNKCNVGWVIPTTFHCQNGKLFNAETEFQFQ